MKNKRKKFEWPKKLFDKPRILEENKLLEKYGLKNKKEIWKADAKIKYYRSRAKILSNEDEVKRQQFFEKLNRIGLDVKSVTDVLALEKEDLLKRRLPSVLHKLTIANTAKHARQMVTHKRVLVSGRVVNIPSYIVAVEEEKLIKVKEKIAKPKPAPEPVAEVEQDQPPTESEEQKVEGEEKQNE